MDEVKENVAMSGHDHDHSSGEQDLCSPFCICTCCSTQMNVPDYFRFQVIRFTFNDDKNSFFKAHVNNAVFATIWQPPKLNLS
jgi:predicted aldo/keto reductase-like oxidoreductase